MADDADRAQETAERLEAMRKQQPTTRPVQRAHDFCLDCGELIEAIRLRAVPTTSRCTFCQTEHERFERLYNR